MMEEKMNKAQEKVVKPGINPLWFRFSILLVLWAICFSPLYTSLVSTWLNHSDNSHGILVPLVSAYFIWQKRAQLKKAEIFPSNWGLLILGLSMVLYLLSYAGSVAVAARAMIVFSLVGLVQFTLGKKVLSTILFPLLFLLFMVPVPDSILALVSLPLQLFATQVSTFVIQAFSIPAYREGNMVYFANTQLEVAEACSGIRSIISYGMLSVIFAYLLDKGWYRRIFLLVSTVPLALFANIVRISGTGVLAHFYGDKVARGFLHEFSGLAVFAFGFVLLFLEYTWLDRRPVKKEK